jgi:uncharacterized protein
MRKHILSIFLLFLTIPAIASEVDIIKKKVTFRSGKYTLSGELLMKQEAKNSPIIIFLPGSYTSSYLTNYKTWSNENLEKLFIDKGFIIFHFDKRGINDSEGKWHTTDFYGRADDTKAAIDFAKNLPFVDNTKIGLVGHSQGGWIAQMVASLYPDEVAFAVSLAGPVYSVRQQMLNDFHAAYVCDGVDSTIAYKKAERKVRNVLTLSMLMPVKKNWIQLNRIKNFDPTDFIQIPSAPVLYLFAENDNLVYPDWNIQRFKELFPNGMPPHLTYHVVNGANHSFKMASFCHSGSTINLPWSKEFQEIFQDWIIQKVAP